MALAKMYPSLKPESLIRHVKLFLPYFKARIRKFHQNCVVSTDVPRGSRYKQSQDERQRMKDDTHDVYPNISDGGTLSAAERNWSTYSFIHSIKRNRLSSKRAEKLVAVHPYVLHIGRHLSIGRDRRHDGMWIQRIVHR
jgi:hypothetical protein